ncbi:hypothetical protein PISL3812_02672 [Talaromyces islandicus]|uniref:C6 finger domain protein n=1 Tax=Talaromyces islandicus TaxID=28573 RepID=A0A0U1LSU1_TALIS|nr:hypothetical protein PISL3812_02672 [Talaromyces islandicus]
MGRPPKKRVRENDEVDATVVGNSFPLLSDFEKDWTSTEVGVDTFHLCPPVYLNRPTDTVESSLATSLEPSHRLQPIFETSDPWPDFSTASAASAMLSMNSGIPSLPSESILPGTVQNKPQCPCLSYLYLCLSTLSSLNAFSVTRATINSLHTTARTAQSVIRCEICPLEFATGMQNVMMLGTLLSVVSDAWLRVSEADAESLGKEIAPVAFQDSVTDDPQGAKATWRQWLRQVIRWSVIGGHMNPEYSTPSAMCSCTPSILSLIREMEARQRRWHAEKRSHNLTPKSDSSSSHLSPPQSLTCSVSTAVSDSDIDPAEEKQNMEERDMLCLKIVGAARAVIERFGFQPWEYPDGVEPL